MELDAAKGLEPRLHFEAKSSWEDGATFAITDGNGEVSGSDKITGKCVAVSVAEEKAVGSYNEWFECTVHLGPDQAKALRDWLIAHFPS